MYHADEAINHVASINITRNRSSADRRADDQDDDDSANDTALPPKLVKRKVQQPRPPITAAEAQYKLNQQTLLILGKVPHLTNITVMVYSMAATTDGEAYLMGGRDHSRYEGEDGARRMRAVEALDDRVRGYPALDLMWPDVMKKTTPDQKRAMDLHSQIHKLVSEQERTDAEDEARAPLFWIDAAHAKTKPRSTTDKLYLCDEAVARKGMVVHLRACIDNHPAGGTCFNTNNVLLELECNSVLRVFVQTKELVIMPKKKKTKKKKSRK